ncbi:MULTISPECIES: type 2 lanthipeptide synthetase LanM family protein [Nostoc]|uniref:Type 2 lantipeptide synthetase LanM n=1 Tax=Nostoc paludosum FACHB-159 TaxID=2692908 RepID=A0ABR8KA32_9NOSO|nr:MULTISPECIES: type 2 lanthipeptide synthetase LanM family protein [Nostoc]MBD2679305.1 type 2 lantipeptide synthetase LanM [Nostoc sp. FACHB-857]MBD2735689.1 type 2 lantipeptide synthetase LanM [Nostoc paludosum FACHB-159]
MKNPVIAKSDVPSSIANFTTIVANASFLWERFDTERFVIDIDSVNEQEIQRRLDRWNQIVGDWNTLHKRLQWESLDLATIRPRLGSIGWNVQAPLPVWAETLQQIMETAKEFVPALEIDLPINPENPIPFEDILLPAIAVARQQLLTCLGSGQLTPESLPLSVLSKATYRELERSLLQRLAGICTKTLNFEFSQVRPFGKNLLNLLGLATEKSNNKTYYNQFVNQLLKDGLLTLFNKYPVLGRLVATAVNFWVESAAEFIQRLAEDKVDIQRIFSSKNDSLGKVSEIQTSLSDPHKRGRTVILLTFESGLKLVYKPKDLGLEVAFNQFLDWCNQHSQLLDFKVIQVLNRDNYGWVEYITHQPCNDEAAVERFYQRAGMLLCVLYALRGTDCHHENLIASGEHLVLVDMETLLHHEANLMENSPNAPEFETAAEQQFWASVLRTGLLPRWDFSSDRRIAYDVSGLGSTDSQKAPQKLPKWQHINTDDMYLDSESVTMSVGKNVPRLGEIALSASDYQAQITAGFEVMYRFLMIHKDILLALGSPLTAMQNQQVRFVFRNTRIYSAIFQKTLSPDYLKHGADYSIELDRLSRAFLVAQEKPNALPILSAELRAMEQLDIPFFTANAASDELQVSSDLSIQQYFQQPSYQHALNQLQAMDEIDLARQTAIIQGSFHAKVAQTPSQGSPQWNAESLPLLSSAELIAEASAIATNLETTAIPDPDGSVNWIGLVYVHEAERFRLQVLGYNLYDGRTGVALFLAALSQVTNDSHSRDLALRALQPLRRQIQTANLESRQLMARLMGIGGATGLGSLIYGLVKVSQFLKDETLLADAQALAELMTPELIAADKKLDIMSGAAGAILGLLSLYRVTGNEIVLKKAIACGEHLLNHRISYENAPKAWQTVSEKPLTGFSHGAAGIAYALLQLYSVTQNQAYYEAAMEGIEYERSVFSESYANWPDFRSLEPNQPPSFPVVWCHGAAGIGLARLGCLRLGEIPGIEREIEIALQTTQNYGLEASDHLCCGNLGRIETLLVGAQRYSRSDLRQIALQNATNVVAKARRTGAYQMFVNLPGSVFHPSLFRGTAGIGYEFLRLASDDLPSVLLWE